MCQGTSWHLPRRHSRSRYLNSLCTGLANLTFDRKYQAASKVTKAWWTGHYDFNTKMGARGQSVRSIINDVNRFASQAMELIILNLSHAVNTDDKFRELNQGEWDELMDELLKLNNRFKCLDEAKANDLSLLSLNEFIGGGKAAVICVVEAPAHIKLGRFAKEGFYTPNQLNVYNDYADTPDCVEMRNNQLKKMRKHYSTESKELFLLSWTLTQKMPSGLDFNSVSAIMRSVVKLEAWGRSFKSLKDMAYSANKALMLELLPEVGHKSFPNVVYIDFIDHTCYAALAIAVNDRVFNN